MEQKWVHIIGICGITTSGVAVMFRDLGWKVTGSDKGFFPPVSDYLKKNGIVISPGFKLERLHEAGRNPDLVVIQGTKGDRNEEYREAQRLGIRIKAYAEILKDYVIVDNSIVVAGSFGKTTTTALLVNIFKQAGIPVSYMFGGLNPTLDKNIAPRDEDTKYSIVEGDEYLTSFNDRRSKFFHYSPRYLLLTGLEYDHVDLFPTAESYFNNFKELIAAMNPDSIIFANIDDQNVQKLLPAAKCKVVGFSASQNLRLKPDWYLLMASKPLPTIIKNPKDEKTDLEIIPFERTVLGDYNDKNILAAAVLAYELSVKKSDIIEGIKTFTGIKRRLEVRCKKEARYVIDDFGSTPAKAVSALAALRKDFPKHRIIAIFEPNAGNRDAHALKLFKGVFAKADLVILPKFTLLPKTDKERFQEEDLLELLNNEAVKAELYPLDQDLLVCLHNEIQKHKKLVIVFLGSHSFRGLVQKTCEILENAKKT